MLDHKGEERAAIERAAIERAGSLFSVFSLFHDGGNQWESEQTVASSLSPVRKKREIRIREIRVSIDIKV